MSGGVRILAGLVGLALLAVPAAAQSLDARLDEDAFLRGLVELDLPEVLEHYVATHPTDDPVRAARHRLATARLARRRADGADARRAAVETVLALRRELIAVGADRPEHAIWLADQATDLLFELLPIEGADLVVLWGRPAPGLRDVARRAAREMNDVTALAELEIERTLLDIESMPGFAEDAGLQARRRRLSRTERERRIPFLRGIAASLHADLNQMPAAERTELRRRAAELLPPLAEAIDGPLGDRAALFAGRALVRLDRGEEAAALFRRIIEREGAHPTDRFAARLGLVLVRERDTGPDAALAALDAIDPGRDAVFFRVLLADRRFDLRMRAADAASGSTQGRLQRKAFAAYLDLLETDAGVPRETMRTIVFRKLAEAAGPDAPLDGLPAIVTVARAERLLRDEGDATAALALLDGAIGRSDLDDRERAAVLFGLGHALYESGRALEAAERFAQLAAEHPTDPEAPRAVELAAAIAREAQQHSPRDEHARDVLRRTLVILLDRFPALPTVDRWSYVAGRLAMEDGDLDGARARFDRVAPGADERLDASFMHAATLRTEARAAPASSARADRFQRLESAAGAAVMLLRDAWPAVGAERKEDLRYYIAQLRVMQAEAALALLAPDRAVAALEGIERDEGIDPDVLAAALRLRIEAYQALDRPTAVRDEVEAFLAAAPDHAAGVLEAILAAQLRDVGALLDAGRPDEARTLAVTELAPVAELVQPWVDLGRIDEARGDGLLRRAADGFRHAGRCAEALRLYDRLVPRHGETIEIIHGRAECLFELGGDGLAEAMRLSRRIAAAGADLRPELWWQAQLRQLEILDRVGRHTDKIAPRIQALRLQDPALGGPRCKTGFQRLERTYGR